MDELLKAIEELKRAYKASGVFNVEVCLWGDNEAVNIVRDDGTEVSQIELAQQKPITNGEWLRGLSDEELAKYIDRGRMCIEWEDCNVSNEYECKTIDCRVYWLRAEHKEVE